MISERQQALERMPLDRRGKVMLATCFAYLNNTILPSRQPGYQHPGYWSYPIIETSTQILASGGGWTDIVTVRSRGDDYDCVITSYIASLIGGARTDVAFRIQVDDGVPSSISINPGSEFHHGFTQPLNERYPLERQKTFIETTLYDVVKIQANNTSGVDQQMLCGLFGWEYYDPYSAGERRAEGQAPTGGDSYV